MIPPITAGLCAADIIQQAFSPSVAVLATPDVDVLCAKNRLSFVELLQPFSRLTVEGQIRDNQSLHLVTHFRLNVRDINWKPASAILARRLLAESVTNHQVNENKVAITGAGGSIIEISPHTPWYDSWRETLWNCLEATDHDFSRHYQATFLVVSSSHPNPAEQFQQLNDQLTQLMANNGTNDGPRWFNSMALRYYVLVHDALEGNASKAEEQFGMLRNVYGFHSCHLLVINSKPKKSSTTDVGLLPAPDPWLRFLPRKPNKAELSAEGESTVDGTEVDKASELPTKVVEEAVGTQAQQHRRTASSGSGRIPLMDALQDAMQEVGILPPSASTVALNMLAGAAEPDSVGNGAVSGFKNSPGLSLRSAVEIKDDPLTGGSSPSMNESGLGLSMAGSETIGSGELHGACLTTDDVDRIQSFINEFCLKSLLPHIERQMKLLGEAASARKSTHRSLLSATKRWFGSQRPGAAGGIQSGGSQGVVPVSYHPESAQLQLRRLGDLAFLVGHYDLAYNSYHSVKKDFEADAAWLHFAGAAEMAALSAYLGGQQAAAGHLIGQSNRSVPFHYFDTALTTYLQTCKMPNWATRCAVLASECHKSYGQYKEAAHQLILLTSEDADLRSAVLLEQAALSFLRAGLRPNSSADILKPNLCPLVRKYAFHMILAGHRFGKAGQKRHAHRAYQLALQVYCDRGWSLAEDHIHYTVGRQCLNGQQIEGAAQALAALLKSGSQQTAAQQLTYLNEFINVHQTLIKHQQNELSNGIHPALPLLPLPVVEGNEIRVLVETKDPATVSLPGFSEATHVTFSDEEVHHPKWSAMEEKLLQAKLGTWTTPASFRATNLLFSDTTNNTVQPQTYCDELVSLEVPLTNFLRIPVQLSDVRLLWRFSGADGQLSNAHLPSKGAIDNPLVTTYVIPRVLLNPNSTHKIIVVVKPKAEGMLTIEGLAFDLGPAPPSESIPIAPNSGAPTATVSGRVGFTVQGPRLNSTAQERYGRSYAPDRRLSVSVGPRMPRLQVTFRSWPEFLFSGEVRAVTVELANANPSVPVSNVLMASNDPLHLTTDLPRFEHPRWTDNQVAIYRWEPAARKTATLWLKGSDNVGLNSLDLMFYYINPTVNGRYRIVRHCSKIFVSSSLSIQTWVQRVPSAPVNDESSQPNSTETLSVQLQIRNLRDMDDTSLSGIEIRQVALLSDQWRLKPAQSVVTPSGPGGVVIHPQESLISALFAIRSDGNQHPEGGFCESVTLSSVGTAPVDFKADPYRNFIRELQKSTSKTTLAVAWKASQASEDGMGSTAIEGLHYFGWSGPDIASPESGSKMPNQPQLITYSMDYSTKVLHNFTKQRLCIIPVVLHIHNCTQEEVDVRYSASVNSWKPARANQLYMPEAASPLMWIGRTQGQVRVKVTSETVRLSVAVSRPGAYSLAQGLQLDAMPVNKVSSTGQQQSLNTVLSPKMEFTLIVDHDENA